MQALETGGASIAPAAPPPWAAMPPSRPSSDANNPIAVNSEKHRGIVGEPSDIDATAPAGTAADPLSGGKRAAWLAVGLLTGFPGALLGWLCNRDTPRRKREALTCSIIGAVAGLGVALVLSGCAVALAQAAQAPQTAQPQSAYIRGDISADHDFRAA